MSDFTDWGENQVAAIIAGSSITFPTAFSIALMENASDATFTPLAGFPRVSAPRSLQTWSGTQGAGTTMASSGSSRAISNNIAFDFGTASASVTANAIGIYSGDNLLAYVLMNTPMTINDGDAVIIAPGEIILTLMNIGGATNYCVNKLHDLIFRGQAFSFPSTYRVGLFARAPDETGGGTESSGNGYARAQMQWTTPADGKMQNAAIVQFPSPVSSWGTVVAFGLYDTAGSLLFFCNFSSPKTIAAGAGAPRFPAGAIMMEVQ